MKLHRWIASIIFIALTILVLGFFKFQQIQAGIDVAASFSEPSATVNTVMTEISEHKTSYQVTGQAVAPQVINIQNELAGTIKKVNFKGGDSVKKGQLILVLNIFEEKAQLVAAKAKLKLAKKSYKRMAVLVKDNKVSQQEFDSAEADLRIAQSAIANLESVISKKQLFASFDGKVGLETYQEGQFLPANSYITTLIGDGPEIWIDFQLAQTKQKLSVGDTVQVSVINDDTNVQFRAASIIAVNSFVKAQSRHLSYRAKLDMGQSWLNHNEIVKVKVFKPAQRVIMVPKAAVNRNHYGSFVFQLIEDDAQQYRAKKVPVELGTRAGDQQVILSGIESEMLIATDGAFKLREGLLVYPKLLANSNADDQTLNGVAK
jgi:membrane fusion protein (multidrug efflux system)